MAASVDKLEIAQYFSEFHVSVSSTPLPFLKLNDVLCSILLKIQSTVDYRMIIDQTFISDLEILLEVCTHMSEQTTQSYMCVTNCYRLCRNMCALCTDNQTHIQNSARFIELTCTLLSNCVCCVAISDEIVTLLRCAVQFLGNYSSGNKLNQLQIWQKFGSLFSNLLRLDDSKLREYVLMVVHITLSETLPVLSASLDDSAWQLLHTCIHIAADSESENGLLVTEDSLKIPGLCDNVFKRLSIKARILLLEILMNTLKRLPDDNLLTTDDDVQTADLPAVNNIHHIAADFIVQSHLIASLTAESSNQTQVLCSVKELECLCIASSHVSLYGSLQHNQQLLITAVSLLQYIEDIGKQGNNIFTNVDKMSNMREVNTEHPVFGLKRDLIRLLGNMAYKHKQNQDLIRELDGLPLILDQTNIDGKNPYITQWSVFAIHNLTEENTENQHYIAHLKLQGVVNNQAVLHEMGLHAETEGGKVVIKQNRKE